MLCVRLRWLLLLLLLLLAHGEVGVGRHGHSALDDRPRDPQPSHGAIELLLSLGGELMVVHTGLLVILVAAVMLR